MPSPWSATDEIRAGGREKVVSRRVVVSRAGVCTRIRIYLHLRVISVVSPGFPTSRWDGNKILTDKDILLHLS